MIKKQELFSKIIELCNSGWHELESNSTGAPGEYLEKALGLKTTNVDIPDSGVYELKFSRGSAMITLFHKTPRPKGSMRYTIQRYGWIGKNGKQSFRHTICGDSKRGFSIVHDSGQVIVRNSNSSNGVQYWTEDDLLNACGRKLSRLLLIRGAVKKNPHRVKYEYATAYENIKLSKLMQALESGLVCIDFDAYIKDSGSVRDHGVKFRVKPENIGQLYEHKNKLV